MPWTALTCIVTHGNMSAGLYDTRAKSLLSLMHHQSDLLCMQVFAYFWAGATIDDKPHLKGKQTSPCCPALGISEANAAFDDKHVHLRHPWHVYGELNREAAVRHA